MTLSFVYIPTNNLLIQTYTYYKALKVLFLIVIKSDANSKSVCDFTHL